MASTSLWPRFQKYFLRYDDLDFSIDTDQALAVSGDAKVRMVREDGSDVRSFSGANDFVESAAVTPDGKIVIAGGQDSVLRVWDGTDGKLITDFPPPAAGR